MGCTYMATFSLDKDLSQTDKIIGFSAGHIPPHVRATADGGDAGEDHDQSLSDRKLSCVAILM